MTARCDDREDDASKVRSVRDVVHRDVIEDLWGAGYTIVARRRGADLFEIDPKIVPATRSYQWMHLVQDQIHIEGGWAAVPASRHDGLFMPAGHVGNIEVNGLGLFEKPKFEVDQERGANIAKAHQQVADWAGTMADMGISGAVSVDGVGIPVGDTDERDVYAVSKSKSLETTVKIPADMAPYMSEIFEERDRMKDEIVLPDRTLKPGPVADQFYAAVEADKSAPWWPTLHAILLPIAIGRVRDRLAVAPKK